MTGAFLLSTWLLLINFSTTLKSNSTYEKIDLAVDYHFAFALVPTYNSGLVSYAIIGAKDGNIVYKRPISLNDFILQIQGRQWSSANEIGNDLFEEHNLDECFYEYIHDQDKYGPLQCFRIEDLWALRYNRNPMCQHGCILADGMLEKGWAANKAYPSDQQMNILSNYGVNHHTDFFYGENMFKLFQDMGNSNWKSNYLNAK